MAAARPKTAPFRAVVQQTPHARDTMGASMYLRGVAFLNASALLSKHDTTEPANYVALHLLCQGMELILKSLLLLKDHVTYSKQLKRFGHDLQKLASEAAKAYGLKALRGAAFVSQLAELAKFYSAHNLRYSGIHDIFVAPQSIKRAAIWRKLHAVILLVERELKGSGIWTPSRVF